MNKAQLIDAIAEKAGLSLEELKKTMSEAGYKLPEPV